MGAATAITVLTQFLTFDVPVCVSQFTLDEVLRHAKDVDEVLGTDFAERLRSKCALSYPALCVPAPKCRLPLPTHLTHALPLYSNVTEYTELSPDVASDVLSKRGLVAKRYILYLSRVIEAKGIFELVAAYRASGLPAAGIQLLIVGRGEALKDVQDVTAGDPNIRHMTDMADAEKASIFNGAASCKLAMLSCHR